MIAYVIRRVIAGVVLLIVMSLVTFLLFFFPGTEPARYACGRGCTPERMQITKEALGYDKPSVVQWGEFMKGIVKGRDFPDDPKLKKEHPETIAHCPVPCLGHSQLSNANVTDRIKDAFPVSASLALMAFLIWITGGILFGVIAALTKGSIIDRGIVGLALVFFACPTFFVGLFLYNFVAIKWQLVPVPSYTPIAEGGVFEWARQLLLPGLTLALFYMAGYVRMTRAFVLESLGEDYVRTARAKGLKTRVVVFKHALRAALTPLVTMAGLDLASVIGGALITESVFNYNGLGKLAVSATTEQDLPISVGIVLIFGSVVIVANIVVDVLYAVIDPRVRVG